MPAGRPTSRCNMTSKDQEMRGARLVALVSFLDRESNGASKICCFSLLGYGARAARYSIAVTPRVRLTRCIGPGLVSFSPAITEVKARAYCKKGSRD